MTYFWQIAVPWISHPPWVEFSENPIHRCVIMSNSPLRLVWLLVSCLYKEVYLQIFKCASFALITRLLRLVGRWARKPVNHTSWVALVTPTDRPKSVRNRCLIELFCGIVCVVTCPFDISVGVGAFVIGLGQISSFLSSSLSSFVNIHRVVL